MGGVFCNFGFGLRKKSWKFGFLGLGGGGYSATSDLALGKKVGNLDFLGFGGGYSETKKSQSAKICLKFNFPGGGYSETQKSKCQDL